MHRFVAISRHIADRIRRAYDRSSDVIYPPVDVQRFEIAETTDDYYLVVSALTVGYVLWLDELLWFDLPDPPWWSIGAFLVMALGLIPLASGIYGRVPPESGRRCRVRKCLLWTTAWALVDALGLALFMALLNVALSLPLA